MTKVYIFGNKGNMGRRYTSILRYLGHEVEGGDVDTTSHDLERYDAFIIATPTDTHLDYIDFLSYCGKPVLCEKPFINDVAHMPALRSLLSRCEEIKVLLTMVSQYDFIRFNTDTPHDNTTHYDYYHSGPDGLLWDCINIIYHAKGPIWLAQKHPIWSCSINGHELSKDMMDTAYIEMIVHWLRAPYTPQYDRILEAHERVESLANGHLNAGTYSHTSKINECTPAGQM